MDRTTTPDESDQRAPGERAAYEDVRVFRP